MTSHALRPPARTARPFVLRREASQARRQAHDGRTLFHGEGQDVRGRREEPAHGAHRPDAYEDALTRKGCRPMDFTGRPIRGFVFVGLEGLESEKDLAFWLELALAYNPVAKKTSKKSR